MSGSRSVLCGLLCVGLAWAGGDREKPVGNKPGDKPTTTSAQIDLATSPSGKPRLEFTHVPLSFEPNLGQSDPSARFVAKSHGYTLQLEQTGARFELNGRDQATASLTMDLENANRDAVITGESMLPGKSNYFPTSDSKAWITDVPTYSRVLYHGVYPGVDVAFYGASNRLEYDFVLQPGARADQIRMRLGGLDGASVNPDGDLVVQTSAGEVRFLKPVAYQMSSAGKRQIVKVSYRLERGAAKEATLVGLALGRYDRSKALVIDPVVALTYAEYLVANYVGSVAADNSGNTYVTGNNNGVGFYVVKFNSSGVVAYTENIGTGAFYPTKITVDGSNKAYVVGRVDGTSSTLPTGSNSYKSTVTGSSNGFYVQVAAAGTSVPYATFLGGTDTYSSAAYGLAVDSSGNSYLGGYTYSGTFPTTSGVYQTAFSGTPGSNYNSWLAKINPAASGAASLVYSTL